jgi:hypothetical protein
MGRHPILSVVLLVFFLGLLARAVIGKRDETQKAVTSDVQPDGREREEFRGIPPPKFRVFKSKADSPTTYIVPESTTDDQLKTLLWFFREKVRQGRFKDIGITQPTAKQWGQYGYKSGMLLVYCGSRCANEEFVTQEELDKGRLGPCGYASLAASLMDRAR